MIDPEAAEVVRMIFERYAAGASVAGIVRELNALHVMPPSVYKTSKGCKGFTHHSSGGYKKGIWAVTSVSSILKDEVYIGNMVQGKYKSASYRSKKMIEADESEWTVVEGTHEAIVTDEQFTIVHERFARSTRVAPNKRATYMLSGLIKCAHCGGRMNRQVSNGEGRFRCLTHAYAPEKCPCRSVKERYLEAVILDVLKNELAERIDAKAIIDAARKKNTGNKASNEYKTAIAKAEREIERIKEAKFRLYDNLLGGVISQAEYSDFRDRYDMQIAEQNENIASLRKSMEELQASQKLDDDFVDFFQKYGNVYQLDREMVNQLLDHVEYTDPKHIEIFFKYSENVC